MTVALDTNILIYWLDSQTKFHAQATSLLRSLIEQNKHIICSTVLITELLSQKGASLTGISKLPIEWIYKDPVVAEKAGRLRQLYPRLHTPDAIHVATAIVYKADRFVTNDKAILSLKKIDGVTFASLGAQPHRFK